MATWDDMENLSFDELELLSFDELERLSLREIRRVVDVVWPITHKLNVDERAHLKNGLLDGSIPLGVALYEIDDPSAPGVEALFAANNIWNKLKPKSRAEAIAYVGILAAVLQVGVSLIPEEKPDVQVVIQIMPEQLRPTPAPTPEPPAPPAPPAARDI
ncbi:hypothetical protein [Leifsonia sp. NPDC058248]|uniref:hypothetical protein n=1 Tax=Leifsonia sp. NPDC058248 TaxID=3346402 RepID=UPI0036DF6616